MGWWGFGLADRCRKGFVFIHCSNIGILRSVKLLPLVAGIYQLDVGK